MALLEAPNPEAALAQGDILHGLTLFRASVDGEPEILSDRRGEPIEVGLVISRNCGAIRNAYILVAPVIPYRRSQFSSLTDDDITFDQARRYMAGLRDGWGEPDTFYLGPLTRLGQERYAADLGQISPIGLPEPQEARATWLDQRRIARLTTAHRRHLHARLFRAFADEGFDDISWWPDNDLDLIIAIGQSQVAGLQQVLAQAQLALETSRSDGTINPKRLDRALEGKTKKIHDAQARLDATTAALRPYIAERERRSTT